jgi:nitrilase
VDPRRAEGDLAMTRVAIVQEPPVVLDRAATVARAVALIGEAAGEGAKLVVFPEAFVPGYPAWIWRLRPGSDFATSTAVHRRLVDQAVRLKAGDLAPVCAAAAQHRVTVCIGLNDRDEDVGRATLYNAVLVIGPDGAILNHHRKLMPTNPERMEWGFGDGRGLRVVDTLVGRLGVLICWENYMPLARYALYAQGVEIYVAPTYDSGDAWLGSMQHIAREGGCWVLNSGCVLRAADLPADFPERARLYPTDDEWINAGDSAVIAPGGAIVAGPMRRTTGILYADIDTGLVAPARRTFDVAGHYSRPDIFQLQVNRQPQSPIRFD